MRSFFLSFLFSSCMRCVPGDMGIANCLWLIWLTEPAMRTSDPSLAFQVYKWPIFAFVRKKSAIFLCLKWQIWWHTMVWIFTHLVMIKWDKRPHLVDSFYVAGIDATSQACVERLVWLYWLHISCSSFLLQFILTIILLLVRSKRLSVEWINNWRVCLSIFSW